MTSRGHLIHVGMHGRHTYCYSATALSGFIRFTNGKLKDGAVPMKPIPWLQYLSQSLVQTSEVLVNRDHKNILPYLNLGMFKENNHKSAIGICYCETVSSNNENLATSYNFLFALLHSGIPK